MFSTSSRIYSGMLLLALVCLSLLKFASSQPYCPMGWALDSGQCYVISTGSLNWTDARDECRRVPQGDLVSIHGEDEKNFVEGLERAGQHSYTYLGYNDRDEDQIWEWSDGTDPSWTNWDGDHGTLESPYCAAWYYNFYKRWLQVECSMSTGYICKAPVADCIFISDPIHGSVALPDSMTHGSVATYSCDPGYVLTGSNTAICQPYAADKTWTTPPTCDVNLTIDCGDPDERAHGSVNVPGGTTFTSTVTYSCDPGYVLNGRSSAHCQPDATWTEPPVCDLLQVKLRFCQETWEYYNEQCYVISTGSKTWEAARTDCQQTDAGDLVSIDSEEENVFVEGLEGVGRHSYVHLGYNDRDEDQTWEWSDGSDPSWTNWDGDHGTLESPYCAAWYYNFYKRWLQVECSMSYGYICKAPSHVCAVLPSLTNGVLTTYGQTATFECAPGYFFSGPQTIDCQADGTWTDSPTCELDATIDCGPLLDPIDGLVQLGDTAFMSTATYTCNDGFVAFGDMTATCQADATWSPAPTCGTDCVAVPSVPTYGHVETEDGVATYTCSPGYILTGPATSTCQTNNGTWSAPPTCSHDGSIVCVPGGTVLVMNPDPDTFFSASAVHADGECTTAWLPNADNTVTLARLNITGCAMGTLITVMFESRTDGIVGGQGFQRFQVQCKEISDAGWTQVVTLQQEFESDDVVPDAEKTVVPLTVTLESSIRDPSADGAIIDTATAGAEIVWAIDIPEVYKGMPKSVTAYQGLTTTAATKKHLITDGCTHDGSLMESFSSANVTTAPGNMRRHSIRFWAFKFRDSDYVTMECVFRVCPQGSSQCDMGPCEGRKRRAANSANSANSVSLPGVQYGSTSQPLRVLSAEIGDAGDSNAAPPMNLLAVTAWTCACASMISHLLRD